MVVAQLAERPRLFPTPYGPTSNPVIGKFYSAFVYFKLLKNVNKNKNEMNGPIQKAFDPKLMSLVMLDLVRIKREVNQCDQMIY